MPKKNFLLLSMEDTKIKKVSNVISNDSCRKILDYLAEKEATESEIASKLNIPISTVHYNLQQLMETGLIDAEEYHYSEKGKTVNHYRLANKYIIIAPKNTYGIKEKLKGIFPAVLIISGAALAIQLTKRFFSGGQIVQTFSDTKQTLMRETLISQKSAAVGAANNQMAASASYVSSIATNATQAAPEFINKTKEYALNPQTVTQAFTHPASVWSNIALWFLIGAVFALLVYFIISVKKNEKN